MATKNFLESVNLFEGLLNSSKGEKKEMIYKKELFNELSEAERKKLRLKLRKMRDNIFATIVNTQDKTKLKTLCEKFATYYKDVYLINDYSLSSIASENTNEETKKTITQGFEIIKRELKIK